MTSWVEQYRPVCLDEIIGQEHITRRLDWMVKKLHSDNQNDWPHMMFAGRAGVGKTSTAIALMKTAFGEQWKENWLELNASDERSISVIRTKVKDFASRGVIGSYEANWTEGSASGDIRPIPFNVVFLDEADNLTPDAQAALRRMMERYDSTVFIISCNYPHKIIEPIQDRCAFSTTRFRPISDELMSNYITTLATTRKVTLTEDALQKIIRSSSGSMRKATHLLYTVSIVPGEIELVDVEEIVQTLNPKEVKSILGALVKAKKAEDSLSVYRDIDKMIDKQLKSGMMATDILNSMYRLARDDAGMPKQLRHQILVGIGNALHHVSVSQDPALALRCFVRNLTV